MPRSFVPANVFLWRTILGGSATSVAIGLLIAISFFYVPTEPKAQVNASEKCSAPLPQSRRLQNLCRRPPLRPLLYNRKKFNQCAAVRPTSNALLPDLCQ